MNKEILGQLEKKLLEEKLKIEKELMSFASQDPKVKGNWDVKYPNRGNGNMEEEADETQEYDNLLSLEHSLELKLKDVNLALEKMGKGEYGKCEKCNKEIEEDRLMAYPEARLCIECNKQA